MMMKIDLSSPQPFLLCVPGGVLVKSVLLGTSIPIAAVKASLSWLRGPKNR